MKTIPCIEESFDIFSQKVTVGILHTRYVLLYPFSSLHDIRRVSFIN